MKTWSVDGLMLEPWVAPTAWSGTGRRVPVTDPRRVTSCAGLVEAGRATAEAVLDVLGDRTVADLEAVDDERPFAEIEHILRAEAFTERSNALGCGAAELTRLACTAYQGLSTQARGEAAREFLAPYFLACD